MSASTSYAERAYFDREPCHHVATYEAEMTVRRLERRWSAALRDRRSNRRSAR